MKKLAIVMSIAALTVSAYAAPKTTADAVATNAAKATAVKAACPACTAAGGMCPACKAKKVADEKAACASGVCPLAK